MWWNDFSGPEVRLYKSAWACAVVLSAFAPCSAAALACVGDSPIAVTRWVSTHRPRLVAPDANRFITAEFLNAIRRDSARASANNEICGICGGDLWTNSQEGYARPPISFYESGRSHAHAEVIYSLRFSIEPKGPSEPRSARIALRKEQGCWKIDDIVHGDDSIKRIVSAGTRQYP
jgi:hypothetical protein